MTRFQPSCEALRAGDSASLVGSGAVLPPQQTLAFLSRSAHSTPLSHQLVK